MATRHVLALEKIALLFLIISFTTNMASGQSSTFNYQGRLTDGGNLANGNYDFEFRLFTAPTDGTQVGSTLPFNNITVTSGSFEVTLNFGAAAFPGADRFLEISVRPAGGGSFTTLNPRQQILSAP